MSRAEEKGKGMTLRSRLLVMHVVVGALTSAIALALAGVAYAANPTTLSINCTPKATSPGTASSCVATVTDAGVVASRVPPTGNVSFTVDGSGTFDPGDTCALESAGAFSSKCTVGYTPTAISGGSHRLLATYSGDDGHGRATSVFTLVVAPTNDDLGNATQLPVPGKLSGTTEGATYSDSDPELCSDAYAPVWYSLKPAQSERIAVRLTVGGRVDSVVAVFRQDRSKLVNLGCDVSAASGVAGVPFDAVRGTTYLIAVAAPWDAVAGEFALESVVVPPVKLPGVRLARDADVSLDPLLHPAVAFSVQLRQATTYRINAAARGACVHVELRRDATVSAADLATSEGCSGYLLYTPGPGAVSRFPLVVSMSEGRAASIHVAIRQAEIDDLAPGTILQDATIHRGRFSARDADVVDVYNFRVPARGDATLGLHGNVHADLLLLDERGKRLACACDGLETTTIVQRLAAGSYLAIVRSRPAETGSYALALRLREPTTATVRLTASAGAVPRLALVTSVSPANVGGHLVLELERFDPLTDWHFVARVSHAVAGGGTTFSLTPKIGGWRVRARYSGTLSTSSSVSEWIDFTVDAGTTSGAATAQTPAPSCAPGSSVTLRVGGLTLSCVASLGGGPGPSKSPATSPSAQLRDLKAVVAGVALLKDPFKSDLVGNLDAAIAALADHNADEARAQLDQFVTTVQSAPLQAQLTSAQRARFVTTAKTIEAQIGP
jgi:hypothetical protein